jgi:hypothetical protein
MSASSRVGCGPLQIISLFKYRCPRHEAAEMSRDCADEALRITVEYLESIVNGTGRVDAEHKCTNKRNAFNKILFLLFIRSGQVGRKQTRPSDVERMNGVNHPN